MRAVLALLLLQIATAAAAQQDDVHLFVEVLDAKGKVPADLVLGDLEIREGAAVLPLSSLTRWSPDAAPARTVIYFDRALSSNRVVKRAASALAELARPLTALGEVEVVSAGIAPESELRSRDELVVGEKLSRAALTDSGERRVLELRQRVLRDLRLEAPPSSALAPEEIAEIVTAGIEEEIELVRERVTQLLAWASEASPASSPAAARSARPARTSASTVAPPTQRRRE